jgi:hypothetical protein
MPVEAQAGATNGKAVRAERDPSSLRGTGGLLRDLAENYDDDHYLLVASATQVLLEPLSALVGDLAKLGADVCVLSHADGTPSLLMLVRCGTLRWISPVGYVDLKEQALPEIARRFDVKVLDRPAPTGMPVWTREDYVEALRAHHLQRARGRKARDAFAEDWEQRFSIVEEGACVHPEAVVHDSVVLRGARVEKGAVVVRSLVCPGEVVRPRSTVVRRFAGGLFW